VQLGADCKIQNHTSVCEGVTIRDRVFVGHGVVFIPTGICRKRSSKKSRASVRPLRFSAAFALARALVGAEQLSHPMSQPGEVAPGVPARVFAENSLSEGLGQSSRSGSKPWSGRRRRDRVAWSKKGRGGTRDRRRMGQLLKATR